SPAGPGQPGVAIDPAVLKLSAADVDADAGAVNPRKGDVGQEAGAGSPGPARASRDRPRATVAPGAAHLRGEAVAGHVVAVENQQDTATAARRHDAAAEGRSGRAAGAAGATVAGRPRAARAARAAGRGDAHVAGYRTVVEGQVVILDGNAGPP